MNDQMETRLNTVQKVLHDAKANEKLVTLFIDDYHNIHTHHRPSSDTQTQVVHMATLLIKVFDVNAILMADAVQFSSVHFSSYFKIPLHTIS